MRESVGDLFTDFQDADAICITTNGFVKADGRCVMGRGCAKTAKNTWLGVDKTLGDLISKHGNHVHGLLLPDHDTDYGTPAILSFPVKHHWREEADLKLIKRSARELMAIINGMRFKSVILPRPGCGNGRLKWRDVKSVLKKILDDRVIVVTNE